MTLALAALAVVVAGCAWMAPRASATPTGTSADAEAFRRCERLGRGVNMGNALEAPSVGEWGVTLDDSYFQVIKEAGFNSVRIPIRWSAHATTQAPYMIDPSFFVLVDKAVHEALAQGLTVIIDMHHYEELYQNPAAHQERFVALWAQIAGHYQGYPLELYFEPLNEPNGALSAGVWNSLFADVLATIRRTNPNRMVVVGPVEWNAISQLRSLELPPQDRRLIVTVHYYDPMSFTHQGAEWVEGSEAWLGTTWEGAPGEQAAIRHDFDLAAAWAKAHGRPLFLGEFGTYDKADMDSRVRWTTFVAREAEAHGWSWAYWEFCAGFGVYDAEQHAFRRPLLEALIPPET